MHTTHESELLDIDVTSGLVDADLEIVLAAWRTATERLRQTHESLRREVGRLTDELERKNRELARKNRLADLGMMASHVAHEVRNSLAPVTLYLSLLRRRINGDSGSLDILQKIESGFTALESTVSDLLQFSAQHEPSWGQFDVGELIGEIRQSLAPQFAAQGIDIEVDAPIGPCACGDREMLRRAILNLMLNALDVMPQGGELVVTAYHDGESLQLEVADNGPGIDYDCAGRLFEPFFSTKSGGTGLGLAIVERIATAHGGDVSAMNCPEGGAAFTLRIPQPVLLQRKAA